MRHSRIGISALTLLAATTFVGAAQAQQAYNWTGFYAGVYGGYSVAGQATDALNCPQAQNDSSSSSSAFESITLTGAGTLSDYCSGNTEFIRSFLPTSQSQSEVDYGYPGLDEGSPAYDYYQEGYSQVTKSINDLKGWMAGTEAGYLGQMGNFVLGAELSGALTNIGDSRDSYESHYGGSIEGDEYYQGGISNTHGDLGIDWLTTATARAGYASGRMLFTADAGLALAGTHFTATTTGTEYYDTEAAPFGGSLDYGGTWTDNHTATGWTAGARVDVGLTDNTSLFLAYNYVSLPGVQYSGQITNVEIPDPEVGLPSTAPATQTFKYDLGVQLIKAGIDFHW